MGWVTSRLDGTGNTDAFADQNTDETILAMAGCQFVDDFIGAVAAYPAAGSATIGCPWVTKLVKTAGSPSAARIANQVGGIVGLALDSTSEAQEATLYFGDTLTFDLTNRAFFEALAAAQVVPSASGVEMVLGLMSTWISGPDNNTCFARFKCSGNGNVLCETFDGTTLSSNASGVVLTAGQFHAFRIDATYAPATAPGVRFWIDGTQLSFTAGNLFAATTGGSPSSVLQPYLSVFKPSGAGVATLYADKVECWSNRPPAYL